MGLTHTARASWRPTVGFTVVGPSLGSCPPLWGPEDYVVSMTAAGTDVESSEASVGLLVKFGQVPKVIVLAIDTS